MDPITFPKAELHPKEWSPPGDGERWITNNNFYCMKILPFKAGYMFSMHYHMIKTETWFVSKGSFVLRYFDLSTAEKIEKTLNIGDIVHIPNGNPHQLFALQDSEIIEVSTPHKDEDSYRIGKGASQK